MERISPARRNACIQISLPPIRTARDVEKAADKITQAIQRGELTPAEGSTMMNILDGRSRIIENVHLESRLLKVEEILAVNVRLAA